VNMDERTAKVATMPILLIRTEVPTFDARVPIGSKDITKTMTSYINIVLPKDVHN
jgi:hypothetical protein